MRLRFLFAFIFLRFRLLESLFISVSAILRFYCCFISLRFYYSLIFVRVFVSLRFAFQVSLLPNVVLFKARRYSIEFFKALLMTFKIRKSRKADCFQHFYRFIEIFIHVSSVSVRTERNLTSAESIIFF